MIRRADLHALQGQWDAEARWQRIRDLRAAARRQGEPGLLAGTALLAAPFAIVTLLALGMGAFAA